MAVTTTVYDINDKPWTLTINGTTPSALKLVRDGITIEYPDYGLDEPLILPKFTFAFLGDISDVEAFGLITQNSHSFVLTHTPSTGITYTWKGYLSETLFNIANTGFDEPISINGISDIEAIKYNDYTLEGDLVKISDVVTHCLSGTSYASIAYNLSFTLANLGYVATSNWFDEEGTPFNRYDVLKYICTFYALIFDIDFQQKITISSYSELQRPSAGILNYSDTKHQGISETYSNSENWLSAEIKDSILKPEDVLVNLSVEGDAEEPPFLYKIERMVKTGIIHVRYEHVNPYVLYENRLHVIGKDEYPNWTFPHYNLNGDAIANWWDRDSCLSGALRQPIAGMYKLSYRTWDAANPVPTVPLTSCFLVKTFNHVDGQNPTMIVNNRTLPTKFYAEFSSKFTAGESQYLLFSGTIGFSVRFGHCNGWGDAYMFNNHYKYSGIVPDSATLNFYDNQYESYKSESDVFCPFANRADQHNIPVPIAYLKRQNTMLGFEVKFRDMWWDGDTEDWVTTRKVFKPTMMYDIACEDIVTAIADHYPPIQTPLYEDLGRGYAIRFGKRQDDSGTANFGTGTLEIRLYVFNSSNQYPTTYYPVTFWLKNFNFNVVDSKDDVQVKDAPKSPVYAYGNKKKPSHSSVTNYLMSSYEDIISFSQVYTDSAGAQLNTLSYSLPVYNASGTTTNYSTTEKPEQMQLRIIKQLISSQVTLSDIIEFTNFINKRQILYNSRILVRDGFSVNALMNIVNVNYVYRRLNYS
jgi:hypothetical protein